MTIEETKRYDIELLTTGRDEQILEKFLQRVKGLAASPSDIVAACPCLLARNVPGAAVKKLKYYCDHLEVKLAVRENHPAKTAPTASVSSEAPVHQPPEAHANHHLPQPTPAEIVETAPPGGSNLPAVWQPDNQPPDVIPYQVPVVTAVVTPANASRAITLKRSVAELTRSLQDRDWTVREQAILELGQVPSNGVIRHILNALKDDVWRVRCTALHVLSSSGSNSVLRDIAKCIEDDVWHVRYHTVEALGRLESDHVFKPLLAALNDSTWQVRQRAVQILGALHTRRAVPALSACLKDEVWHVRESAAEALARLKSEKAVKALVMTLHDENWRVRSMVVTALREIGSQEAVAALVDALSDPNWMVHWKAANALGKIGTPTIFPVLCRMEKENAPFLGEVARKVLSTLDIVVEPRPHAQPRLEYRSEDPYANMRYIPGGEFVMGDDNGHVDARPMHRVTLPEFFIDVYEVTNAQYKRFNPSHSFLKGMEHYPVVNVTWEEAQAYARWLGKRLPKEAEWEKAARGTDGRLYPWGDAFDPAKCNTEESGNRRLTPVNQYPAGKSAFQVHDLFGNVLEWTADRYQPYPGSPTDHPDFRENFIVLRGCPWIHQGGQCNCASRTYAPAENRNNFIGFRCVRDVQ